VLEGVRVGDEIGFTMESQQISQLQVLGSKPAPATAPARPEEAPVRAPPPKASDDLGRAAFRR